MRFSKNTHKPDIFTISNPMKRDDVSMPILKVSPGQDLGTKLQKKVGEIDQKRPRHGICPVSPINTSVLQGKTKHFRQTYFLDGF